LLRRAAFRNAKLSAGVAAAASFIMASPAFALVRAKGWVPGHWSKLPKQAIRLLNAHSGRKRVAAAVHWPPRPCAGQPDGW
jgi:hypothetical protein